MDNLPSCMNTGICTTGNDAVDLALRNNRNRFFDLFLNCSAIWLFTPTKKVCSVVSKIKPQTKKPTLRVESGFRHENNF